MTSGPNNPNFTETQADAFVAQYQLLDQLPNVSLNGFSASVFEDKQGKHVIAMRGTEMSFGPAILDLLVTDGLSIGGNGFANNQAVEMYRYYKRLVTPGGQAVSYSAQEQWQLFSVKNSMQVPLASALPILAPALAADFPLFKQELASDQGVTPPAGSGRSSVLLPSEKVDVTGHSLGGQRSSTFSEQRASRNRCATTPGGLGRPDPQDFQSVGVRATREYARAV